MIIIIIVYLFIYLFIYLGTGQSALWSLFISLFSGWKGLPLIIDLLFIYFVRGWKKCSVIFIYFIYLKVGRALCKKSLGESYTLFSQL